MLLQGALYCLLGVYGGVCGPARELMLRPPAPAARGCRAPRDAMGLADELLLEVGEEPAGGRGSPCCYTAFVIIIAIIVWDHALGDFLEGCVCVCVAVRRGTNPCSCPSRVSARWPYLSW